MSINSAMGALRLHGRGDIRLDTVAIQNCCLSDQVRVQVAFCGICGSDIHEYLAGPILAPGQGQPNPYTGASLPIIMGHEISGTIIEVGDAVKGFSVGQKVVVNPLMTDFEHGTSPCLSCLNGRFNICKRATFHGFSFPGGGFSDQLIVKASNILSVPESVPLKIAALCEPLAVASHMVQTSGFSLGQNVLILGAGPIGLALLMILRSKGANKVVVSEISSQRIQLASQFGADKVVNPLDRGTTETGGVSTSTPVLDVVQDLVGEGVDIAFDVSGLQTTLDTSIAAVRPGGTIFNVALHEKPLLVNLNALTISEKRLTGGICYTKEDFEEVLAQLSFKHLVAEQMITSIVPLANIIEDGFLELVHNRTKHVKILIEIAP